MFLQCIAFLTHTASLYRESTYTDHYAPFELRREYLIVVCQENEALMFETLEERIEQSEGSHLSTQQKLLRYIGLTAITGVVFGALFMAVQIFG